MENTATPEVQRSREPLTGMAIRASPSTAAPLGPAGPNIDLAGRGDWSRQPLRSGSAG
jgi:hypothetical protein